MLSIEAIGHGKAEYYLRLANKNYYLEGGEPPGRWLGQGAAALGLQGEVDPGLFRRMFDGFAADGTCLVQNAGQANRRPGWDLTFSAPKSVSIYWSLATPEERKLIQAAHFEAVQTAIAFLEKTASFTRRGKGGQQVEPAQLVVATFEHSTSRALDAALHTHAATLNIAVRDDGTTGSLVSLPFYQSKLLTGAVYRSSLAARLRTDLGFVFREGKGNSFEIEGISQLAIDQSSKRRRQVEELMNARGQHSAQAAHLAALETRPDKEHISRLELFAKCAAEAVGLVDLAAVPRQPPIASPNEVARDVIRQAADHLTESRNYFSKRELTLTALVAGQAHGLRPQTIIGCLNRELRSGSHVVKLAKEQGQVLCTTQAMLVAEGQLLSLVEKANQSAQHLVTPATLDRVLAKVPTLKDEQRKAVEYLTLTPGEIKTLNGTTGSGKTSYVLGTCRRAWEREGFTTLGVSTAATAARTLESDSGIKSFTIAKLLYDLNKSPLEVVVHNHKQFARAADGQEMRPLLSLDKKTVLVIDEAGMVSTPEMISLLAHADKAGAKVVLIGDKHQIPAIGRGGAFEAVSLRTDCALLVDNQRQRHAWARRANGLIAAGFAAAGLAEYASRGLITVTATRQEAMHDLVSHWVKQGGVQDPANHLNIVNKNTERREVNRLCQAERLKVEPASPQDRWYAVRLSGQQVYKGDTVVFLKNSPELDVCNGHRGKVVKTDRFNKTVSIYLQDGRMVNVDLRKYGHIELGYALTTYKAQGATCEYANILAGGRMQCREQTNVQLTRAKQETRLFISQEEAGPGLETLTRHVSRSESKFLASEFLPAARLRSAAITDIDQMIQAVAAATRELRTLGREHAPTTVVEPTVEQQSVDRPRSKNWISLTKPQESSQPKHHPHSP